MNTIGALIVTLIIIIAFGVIRRKPHYSFALYYASIFARQNFFPSMQVRYQIGFQLLIITFALFSSYFAYSKHFSGYRRIKLQVFQKAALLIFIVASLETINGLFHSYRFFQILVDIYKVAEILIFYFFASFTLRSRWQIEKCLSAVTIEMCIFGIIEMFTTNRGGVGFNIAMHIFPIILATGIYVKTKRYWITLLIILIIAFTSKTRTYMIGMLFALFTVLTLGRGKRRGNVVLGLIASAIIITVGLYFYTSNHQNAYLQRIFSVIQQLSEGFTVAGGYRIYEIRTAIQKFAESPILGKGYGYMEYVYIKLMGYFEWGDFMHNTYVEILAKTGLFGSIIYGFGLLSYLIRQYKMINDSEAFGDGKLIGMMIGGFAGTICWLITYIAAPLSSYGYIFMPGIISILYYKCYIREEQITEEYNITQK